ncbi:BatD family protein [Motiliproteus sp. MSK22-1]|uniref:BatD family protein n=1 Tax=Motiliproteus sp. MSK22-1 TaxID=1897630 RepID=UPI000975F009|nr:BatD family protein [Motiliproteus sp. MSK22-1]OMH32835.1 hypothetical protein BGP75_15055 [Motiliproteus sp. MSK22-1]
MLKHLLPFLLLSSAAQAQITVEVDHKQGPANQTFEMVLEAEQRQPISTPDFSGLEKDFRILNNSKNSVSNFRGGKTYYNSRWTIRLRPKRTGELKIPAIRVGSERSRALSYTATEEAPPAEEIPVFLDVTISPELNYTRSAYVLSVKLLFDAPLSSAQLTEPLLEGVRIEQLGSQLNYSETRNDQNYQVIEQRYILFPLSSKRYRLPPIEFTGLSAEGEIAYNTSSEAIEFEALEPPPEINPRTWLAATELRVEQQWDKALQNLRVGDTLVRTLIIEAHNTPADWLPNLHVASTEGVSVYPQAPKITQETDTGTLVSRKELTYKLLLTKAGQVRFPAIEIPWWDTIRDIQDTSRISSTSVDVENFLQPISSPPAASEVRNETTDSNGPTNDKPNESKTGQATTASSSPWLAWLWATIAIICAIGWTLTWSRLKRLSTEQNNAQSLAASLKEAPTPPGTLQQRDYQLEETNAFNRLSRACSINDPERTAEYLLQWAKLTWPEEPIGDLADIEFYAQNPTLTYLIRDLEHSIYSPQDNEDPWQGDLILSQITLIRRKLKSGRTLEVS